MIERLTTVLAVASASGAVALAVRGDAIGRVVRLGRAPAAAPRRLPSPAVRIGAAALAGLIGFVIPGGAVVAVLAFPFALVAMRIRRRRLFCRAVTERRVAVIEFCQVMVPELFAGGTPREALARAGAVTAASGDLPLAALAAADDVPTALRVAAKRPGAEALASMAACWQVAQHHGGGLAPALRRLADSLRAEEALRRDVASQLAAARATARLLAALPALGLLLGSGLGGNPVGVLLTTTYGLACLLAGVTLQVVGVWWTDRIAAAAERRG